MCCVWQWRGISCVLFTLMHNGLFLQLNSSVGLKRTAFYSPPLHKNIKQRRLPVANQASVAGGLKRLNSNARNAAAAAATPLCGKINNAKRRFQSHECEAGFSNRWSTQTGEDCLFSAALVTSSGEHSNKPLTQTCSGNLLCNCLQKKKKIERKREKRGGGGRLDSALPLNLGVRAVHTSKRSSQRRYKLLGSLCSKCNTGANIDQLISVWMWLCSDEW